MIVKKSSWYCWILHAPMTISQETADNLGAVRAFPNLGAVEAFLDEPEALIWFRCKRCRSFLADNSGFLQDLFPFSMKFLLFDHPFDDPFALPREYPTIPYGSLGVGGLADAIRIDCRICGNWLGYKIVWSNRAVSKPSRLVLIRGGRDDVRGIEAIFPTGAVLDIFGPIML